MHTKMLQKRFSTQLMGKDLLYWTSLILNISKKGLSNRNVLNKKNMNERNYLLKSLAFKCS